MSNKPNRRPSAAQRARTSTPVGSPASASRVLWIVGAVAVVIVTALVVAVVATRSSDPSTTAGPLGGGGTVVPAGKLAFGDVTVDGAALPVQPEGSRADPAVGKKAPTLTGEQFDGAPLTVAAPGKPAVVMFLAHWCPHCQKEVPVITQWLTANGLPEDVNLYAVATSTNDQAPNFPPGDWLHRENWPVPTIVDDKTNTAAQAYGIGGFPYFVVLDSRGDVVLRTSGELSTEQFQALLDAARAGPASLPSTAPGPAR